MTSIGEDNMKQEIKEKRKEKQLERLNKVLALRIAIPPPLNSKLEKDCLIHREGIIDFKSFYFEGKVEKIYRLVYSLENGNLKKGDNILHYCNRLECSEPTHLYLKEKKERKEKKLIEEEDLKQVEAEMQEFINSLKS